MEGRVPLALLPEGKTSEVVVPTLRLGEAQRTRVVLHALPTSLRGVCIFGKLCEEGAGQAVVSILAQLLCLPGALVH